MRARFLSARLRSSITRVVIAVAAVAALSFAAFGAQAPASAAAGAGPVTPACAWYATSVSINNNGEQDSAGTYYELPYQMQSGLQITLDGRYADSRYISLQAYTSTGALFSTNGVSSDLTDYQIQPDPGSVNPWQKARHARHARGAYTVTLRSDAAPGQVNTLPLAPAGTADGTYGLLEYRVYLPAHGEFAKQSLPAVTFTLDGVSEQVPACPPGAVLTPPSATPTATATTASAVSAAAAAAAPGTILRFGRPVPSAGGGVTANADAALLTGAIVPPDNGDVLVIRGQAATAARGNHPSPWPARGIDMQYWSLCDYLYVSGSPLVANQRPDGKVDYGCRNNSRVALDRRGYYTFVVGTEAQRAAIGRIPGTTFLPFSTAQPTTVHVLVLRDMDVSPSFSEAVQDVPQNGTSASAATVMGPYYPTMAVCPLTTLASGGFTACQAAAAS